MTSTNKPHTYKRFDEEIQELHLQVTQMGQLLAGQIELAKTALREGDVDKAQQLIRGDRQVNQMDIHIDELLLTLLARRQPVAKDLRDLLTVSKIITDLERVGDQVRKVGTLVQNLYSDGTVAPRSEMLADIEPMMLLGQEMLEGVLESFGQNSLEKAAWVIETNEKLERQFQHSLRTLTTFVLEDPKQIGHSIQVTLCMRALERVGGHAKNIAGYVVFLATGEDVRHQDDEEVRSIIRRWSSS